MDNNKNNRSSLLEGYYLDDQSLKRQREDEEAKNRGRRGRSPTLPQQVRMRPGATPISVSDYNNPTTRTKSTTSRSVSPAAVSVTNYNNPTSFSSNNHQTTNGTSRSRSPLKNSHNGSHRSRSPGIPRTRSRSPLVGDVHIPEETARREKMRLAFFSSSTASQHRINMSSSHQQHGDDTTENKRDSLEKSSSMPKMTFLTTTSIHTNTSTPYENAAAAAAADGTAPRNSLERSISMPRNFLLAKKNRQQQHQLQASTGSSHNPTAVNSNSHRSSHRSSGKSRGNGSWRGSLRGSLRSSLGGSWTNSLKSFLSTSSRSSLNGSSNDSHTRLDNNNNANNSSNQQQESKKSIIPNNRPRSPKSPTRRQDSTGNRLPPPSVQALWGAGGGGGGGEKSSHSMGLDSSLLRGLASNNNTNSCSQTQQQQQMLLEKANAMNPTFALPFDVAGNNSISIGDVMGDIQTMPDGVDDPASNETSTSAAQQQQQQRPSQPQPLMVGLRYDNSGRALKSSLMQSTASSSHQPQQQQQQLDASASSGGEGGDQAAAAASLTMMMQPGAYAGNSSCHYGQANQVPEYSNALGPSTHHNATTTTTTTTDHHDEEETQRKSDFSVGTATQQRNSDLSSTSKKMEEFDDGSQKSFGEDDVDVETPLSPPPTAEELATAEANKRYDQKIKRICYLLVLLVLLPILIVAVVVPVVVLQQQQDDDSNSRNKSEAASPHDNNNEEDVEEAMSSWVVPNMTQVTIQAIEEDEFSSQFMAYDWVSRDPNWDTYDDWQKQQRFALSSLYYSLVSKSWFGSAAYFNPTYFTDECRWIISSDPICNDDGEVILFNIPYPPRNFKGSIPPQIGFLSKLERIEFLNYPFEGETFQDLIPTASLENFPTDSIQEFTLRDSDLRGSIPSELGLLTGLTSLDLRGNDLGSTIPTQLGLLSNLEHVYLSSNLLSGNIPEELGTLSLLTNFQIEDNPELVSPVPAGFCTTNNNNDDGDGDNNRTLVVASFESIQTDWCDNLLDCCPDMPS